MEETSQKPYEPYLKELPQVVQDVIAEVKVPEKLRQLAKEYRLHLDKWAALENEIMLALVGAKPSELLAQNIHEAVGVDLSIAHAMTDDIATLIFRPIRKKLEQALDGRAAQARRTLTERGAPEPQAPPKTYAPGVSSAERKTIHDDPYREPIE